MSRETSVPRPVKKNEYTIVFASKRDQVAVQVVSLGLCC